MPNRELFITIILKLSNSLILKKTKTHFDTDLAWQLICLPCILYFPLQPKRWGEKQRETERDNSCQTVEKQAIDSLKDTKKSSFTESSGQCTTVNRQLPRAIQTNYIATFNTQLLYV